MRGVVEWQFLAEQQFGVARGFTGDRQEALRPAAFGSQKLGETVEPIAFHADPLGSWRHGGTETQAGQFAEMQRLLHDRWSKYLESFRFDGFNQGAFMAQQGRGKALQSSLFVRRG